MQTKVVKFGGSSLADAEHFKQVASIIKADPNRRYVVPSAPGKRFSDDVKVTDMLYTCYSMVKNHENIDDYYALQEIIYYDDGQKIWYKGRKIPSCRLLSFKIRK